MDAQTLYELWYNSNGSEFDQQIKLKRITSQELSKMLSMVSSFRFESRMFNIDLEGLENSIRQIAIVAR